MGAHLIVKVPPAISSMDSVPSRALRPSSLMVCAEQGAPTEYGSDVEN